MRAQLGCGLAFYAVIILCAFLLSPGLGGHFVFDDYANLDTLEAITQDPTLEAGLRYSLTGISSPLGRPLALATFALQYASWPDHPGDFIYVNAALHLLNACLLFWCLLRLLTLTRTLSEPVRLFVALATTWLWLFGNPQAGAVLYVVQRMAVLSGTLTLLGLLLYLVGRGREIAGRPVSGLAFMLSGLAVGVPLGMLAKETAALFPILILCLEYTLLQGLPRSVLWQRMSVLCLWLPAAVVVLYALSYIPGYTPHSYLRSFTIGERLLTEARVLFVYLDKFLLPPLYGLRIYYDDLTVSRSLVSPLATAPSVLGWLALIAAAFILRRRAAPFSFAVLWYLGAHLIESTVIPLELAFDHRNYVALAGPAFALAWYGYHLSQVPQLARVRPILAGGAIVYAAFVAVASWQAATLWGKPSDLAYYWAQQQPHSRRAQLGAASLYLKLRQPHKAIEAHESALRTWPGDSAFFLGILEAGCAYPRLPKADLNRLPGIVRNFDGTIPTTVGLLDALILYAEQNLCQRHSPAELWAIVEMVFETPQLASQQRDRLLLLSRTADLAGDRPLARQLLDQAINRAGKPSPQLLQRATVMSMMAGDLACARHYLARFDEARRSRPLEILGFQDEMAEYRIAVERAMTETKTANPPRPADLPSCGDAAAGSS